LCAARCCGVDALAAQVEVAVSQANVLVLVLVAADHDGRCFGLIQDDHRLRFDFDLTGRHFGIELVGRPYLDQTCDLQHPFSPCLGDDLVRIGKASGLDTICVMP
jgi:hypothetical protein